MRRVEVITIDVGQTDVVAYLRIEVVELQTAAETHTAVETSEGIVGERAVGQAPVLLLDVAADTRSTINTQERLDTRQGIKIVLILYQQRHLQVVHVVRVRTVLSALLRIRQSCLQVDRRCGNHLDACCKTYIKPRLGRATIQIVVVGIDSSNTKTYTKSYSQQTY